MEWPAPLVRPRPRRCELCGCGRAWQHVRFAPKSTSERSARNEKRSAEVECSVRPCLATPGIAKTSTATQAEPEDLPGLLAWHIILLIVAQPGRKRDPDASAGEPPAFGKIVEDHFSRVFVRDSQLGHFLLESKRQGQ